MAGALSTAFLRLQGTAGDAVQAHSEAQQRELALTLPAGQVDSYVEFLRATRQELEDWAVRLRTLAEIYGDTVGSSDDPSAGLEEPGSAGDLNAQLQAMDQRIQSGDKVPLAEVRSALRLYFSRSVQSGGLFFERYLETAERAFHGNPTRVWREVRGTLRYAIIRQKGESYPPEAALADATQTLLERFPRVELQMDRSGVKKVNSAWDRAGAQVVRQNLSAEEVYETLKRSDHPVVFQLPSASELSGWSEERLQSGAQDFLQPGLHYALLRWSGGRAGVVPQSMLLEPSDAKTVGQFRRVLRETVSGNRQKESRTRLIQTFGPRSTSRARFRVRRRRIGSSYILLMSVPTESGRNSPVSLYLPREFWGQVMELVPRWQEGHLQFEVFALEPRRLVRVTQWQEKPPAFRRIGSLKEEWKVEESAQRRDEQAPALDPNRGYRTWAELAQATALPEELLQELGKAGILYRDQENRVPGELAILLQQIDRQIQAASYPLRALEGFLGIQRSAAIEAVRRARVPVIRRPGQRQLLSRENVLRLVLRKKVQDWAVAKGGGLVKWAEAARVFGVNEDDLIHGWRDARGRLRRTPYFDGVPLWIQYEGHRRLTRKGFEGLRKTEETARARIRPDEAVLMDELKRRTPATQVVLGQQLFNAVRALEERGIPSRILEHPLAGIQRIQLVPRDRLDEMFQEMNHPTRWKRSQIQPDFWYSGRTAARLLQLDRSSLLGPIKKGKLQSKKIFNRHFILGASILNYRQPTGLEARGVSAGLEEPDPKVSKWRWLPSWLRGGDPKRSAERLARLLRRNGEEHLYWRRALQWRIESKSGSPIRSLPGRWMDIVQLLRRPAFTAEEVTALLEKMEERPVLSPVHIQDPLGDWEMPLNEVLAVAAEQGKGFILGSLAEGFLTPDSEIELLFSWEGQGEEAVYADLRVPLKRGRPIRMRFFPWNDSWLANYPFLFFQAETLLRENEFKEWIFNGSGWAVLFRRNQEIRDGVRSEGNAVGEVFSEIDVAVEAAALHRDELVPSALRGGDAMEEDAMTLQQDQVLMLLADMGKAEASGDWLAVRKLLDENQPLLRQAQESADPVVRSFFRMIQRIRLNALAPLIESDPSLKAIVVRDFLAGLPGILSDMSSGEMPFVKQQEWSDWMSQALGFLIDKKALNLSELISAPEVVPEAVLWLAMTKVSLNRFLAMVQQSGPAGNPLRDDEVQQGLTRLLAYFMMAEVTASSQQIWMDLNLDVAWVSVITDLLSIYQRIALDVAGRTDLKEPPILAKVAPHTILWQGERMAPPDLLFREALLAGDGATRFNAAAMGLKRLAWIARESEYPQTAEFMRQQAHRLADSVNQQHAAYARSRFWGRNLFPDIFQSSGLEEHPMDARITRAQDLMKQGQVKEAAIELLETLEDLALDGGLKFTRWEEAHQLLTAADETLDLKSVIGPLVSYYLRWLESFPTMELNPALAKIKTFNRVMLDHVLTFWQETTGIKPSQTLRQHWFGEMQSGLEELPGEVAQELRRLGAGRSVSDPFLVLDANQLPLVTRVHRISLNLPSAQDPATRPLALVQEGLLLREVLTQLMEIGWQVEELPRDFSKEDLLAQVSDARSKWNGPLLVVVKSGWEESLKRLTAQGRITGVILDPGFPPDILLSFLNQVLALPERIFRLEYGIKAGLEESYAVSTQL